MTEPTDAFPDALPTGTRLGDFVTTGVIGAGGFGTVYLAREESLDRIVAIKEYLPSAIAARGATQAVLPRSQSQRDGFVAGLHSFMREARLQAQFSHPALLEVYRVWEQNGTAYMAMRYYPGTSLREMRKLPEAAAGYDEAQIQAYLLPVCDAVRELHQQNILHRDVSPDNILIMPNGAPVLLDFGAARSVVAGATQSLTTVLKPGYAPIEQYADDGSLEQGPWTDVYGLGAVMYFLAMGTPPPQAVNRMVFDSLKSFDETTRGRYSETFVAAVKQALAVRPENRLRSVDALCDALGWSLRAPIPPLQTYFAPVADPVVTAEPAPPAAITARPATVAQTSSSVADGAIAKPLAVEPAPEAVTATTRMDRPRRPYWVIVVVLLAASAAAIALLTRKPGSDSNVGQGAPVIAPTTTASPAATTPKASALPTSEPTTQGGITKPSSSPSAVVPGPASKTAEPPAPTASPVPAAASESISKPTASTSVAEPLRKGSAESKPAPGARPPVVTGVEGEGPAASPSPSRPARDADCDRLLTKLSLGTVALTEAEHARLRACR